MSEHFTFNVNAELNALRQGPPRPVSSIVRQLLGDEVDEPNFPPMSQESQESQAVLVIDTESAKFVYMSEEQHDLYEERAAIIEFEGGHTRTHAEHLALIFHRHI